MGKTHKLHLLLLFLMIFGLEEAHIKFMLGQAKPLIGFFLTGILFSLHSVF